MKHADIAETPIDTDNCLLRGLDTLNCWLSRPVFWLTLVMVLAACMVVILRRFLGVGSIALQEAVVYLHATVFLLGAASAFKAGAMVRVDIFYRRFSDTTRAWIDALGTLLFLLPFCIFVFWISWDFVARAWFIGEQSSDAGGLAYVYLLKTLILLFALTLMLQALAELVRASLVLISPKATGEQRHAD
ncbi:MAG TPA: TRAP transporter small permease subunit [Cellvibrionaceae bacterium]